MDIFFKSIFQVYSWTIVGDFPKALHFVFLHVKFVCDAHNIGNNITVISTQMYFNN